MVAMKSRQKYFLHLTILIAALFAFAAFSVIYIAVNPQLVPEAKKTEHMMSFVYLIIHLLVLAVASYFAIKAYFLKPMIVNVIMTTDRGEKNKKAYRNSLVFSIIFGLAAIFFFLNAFQIIHVLSFFSLGLNITLTNVFLSVASVALILFFYKPTAKEEDKN